MNNIPIWVRLTVLVIALFLVTGFLVFGWFASSKILGVNRQTVKYDQVIKSISGDNYTISGSVYNQDGIFGGYNNGEKFIGIFEAPTNIDDTGRTSTRKLTSLEGAKPSVGDSISLQGNIWLSDPKQALGLNFENVNYQGPLGQMDAWVIKSEGSSTWTIGVHGIGAPKREMLRFIKPVIDSGSNMMVINYRNDENNPKSPDEINHLGGTEWQDLESAVNYARANGAQTINLYGVSLGGSVVENYLRQSFDVTQENINKVILDSPALNWKQILIYRIKKDGYPGLAYYPAATLMKLRGVSVAGITTEPDDIEHKTLIIHNADDSTVPQAASKKIAEARPELVSFVGFMTGEHTRAWNHDPARYEQLVTDFLKQ